MARHLLTDRECAQAAKARDIVDFLDDGGGLKLRMPPSGECTWRFVFSLNGKTGQKASLGRLRDIGLARARAEADKLRKLVAEGTHPNVVKRVNRIQRERTLPLIYFRMWRRIGSRARRAAGNGMLITS